MSKGVRTMRGIPTETSDLSQQNLNDSRLIPGKTAEDQSRPPECGFQLVAFLFNFSGFCLWLMPVLNSQFRICSQEPLMGKNMLLLSFFVWITSLSMNFSSFIHLPAQFTILLFITAINDERYSKVYMCHNLIIHLMGVEHSGCFHFWLL